MIECGNFIPPAAKATVLCNTSSTVAIFSAFRMHLHDLKVSISRFKHHKLSDASAAAASRA
jgi:hypothetical protein